MTSALEGFNHTLEASLDRRMRRARPVVLYDRESQLLRRLCRVVDVLAPFDGGDFGIDEPGLLAQHGLDEEDEVVDCGCDWAADRRHYFLARHGVLFEAFVIQGSFNDLETAVYCTLAFPYGILPCEGRRPASPCAFESEDVEDGWMDYDG
jgi:hypothetical protein